jgi:hypothetical protein
MVSTLIVAAALRPAVHAAGTLTIEQIPVQGFTVVGEWTLLRPDQNRVTSNNPTPYTTDQVPPGNYLLNILPPSGMAVRIAQTINGETSVIEKPQTALILSGGETVAFSIQYILKDFGKVSVTSEPPGLPFTLTGPDGAKYSGETPSFYDPMPIGLYSVTFDEIEGCATPNPLSGRLLKDSRVVLAVTLSCANLPRQEEQEKNLRFVTATVDGKQVVFNDTPLNQWFSAPIHRAIEAKVMSGYRDAQGNPTGKFGPDDPVTIAELAKIAHTLAGIDEKRILNTPENPRARGTWFSQYVASAEQVNWLVFLNRSVDPLRPATRAEVVATIMQALKVPRDWPTGKMFTDVTPTMPYADCVETAVSKGLATGYTDDQGKSTHMFGPADPVNRAQMAKIIGNAMDVFLQDSPSFQPDNW